MRKYSYPIIIGILIIMLSISVERCRSYGQNAQASISALADTVTYYANRIGTQSASIKTLQLGQTDLEAIVLAKDKQLTALTKEFGSVKSVVQYNQIIKYDTVTVIYNDSVPCLFNRSGKIKTNWYSFNYNANNKGFIIDSLNIPNQAIIITGFKRKWFLGKEIVTTDVTHTNPNISVANIKSAEVVLPSPWYKKWYVWLGAGVLGGIMVR